MLSSYKDFNLCRRVIKYFEIYIKSQSKTGPRHLETLFAFSSTPSLVQLGSSLNFMEISMVIRMKKQVIRNELSKEPISQKFSRHKKTSGKIVDIIFLFHL